MSKQIKTAIIKVLTEADEPIKRSNLIAKCYEITKQNIGCRSLDALVRNQKIERTKQGFYQIASSQVERN